MKPIKSFYEFVNENYQINEAFSIKTAEKAYELIANFLSKKMGSVLNGYPWLEEYTKADGQKGTGKRYYSDDMRSIRLNIAADEKSVKITSIDYWDGSSVEPQYTIHAFGQSMAKILPAVAEKIMNPASHINESEDFEFAQDELNEGRKDMTDAQKKSLLADSHSMDLKQLEKKYKIAPNSILKILKEMGKDVVVQHAKKETRVSADEDKAIKVNEMSLDDEVKLLGETLEDLEQLVKAVIADRLNGLMVSGKAGTGKSHVVETTLKGVPHNVVKGSASIIGIMQELFKARHGDIIVFDDCDSVFDDQQSRNIFKAALDTKKVRTISYLKQNRLFYDASSADLSEEEMDQRYAERGEIPNNFEFKGKIIFISNLPKDQLDPDGAIRSRSLMVDVSPSDLAILERIKLLLPELEPLELSLEEKLEVFEYIKGTKGASMRTFVKAAGIYMTGCANWKRIVERYS